MIVIKVTVKDCLDVLELRVELLEVGVRLVLEDLDLLQKRIVLVLVLVLVAVELLVVLDRLRQAAPSKVAAQVDLEVVAVGVSYERVDEQHAARLFEE